MDAERIQLRRSRGWRMPAGAVKVDRATPWGNPFVVGRDGTREDCVRLHGLLMTGRVCVSCRTGPGVLLDHQRWVYRHLHMLRGRSLACWCPEGQPCHADTLMAMAASVEQERIGVARDRRDRYAALRRLDTARPDGAP